MLNLDLTSQEAESQLVDPKQLLHWEIKKDDPFVLGYIEACEQADKIVKNNFIDSPEGADERRLLDNLSHRLRDIFNERFAEVQRQWEEILGDELRNYHTKLRGMVCELALNAIEHGSDHCEAGNVVVEVHLGVQEVLCTVDQPLGNGIKTRLSLIDEGIIGEDQIVQKRGGRRRGRGLKFAHSKYFPQVSAEDLDSGGIRTNIFETRDRLLGL